MGTDCHVYIERYDSGSRSWQFVAPVRDPVKYPVKDYGTWGPGDCMRESPCYGPRHDSSGKQLVGEECLGPKCPACLGTGLCVQWYELRDYSVFGILAGVRDRGMTPICESRGMPDNASARLRVSHSWDHTPSWYGLEEILGFDWDDTKSKETGVIPFIATTNRYGKKVTPYKKWRFMSESDKVKCDYAWSISGPSLGIADANQLLDNNKSKTLLKKTYADHVVEVSYEIPYRTIASSFLAFIDELVVPLVPDLKDTLSIAADAKGSDNITGYREVSSVAMKMARGIRLVFGFDS